MTTRRPSGITPVLKDGDMAASRSPNIELLRIVSMLMIMCLHYLGQGQILKSLTPVEANYYAAWILEAFCYVSVNCYVLISGYFLIESQFKGRKIVFLWLQIFFYSVVIYVILLALGIAEFNLKSLVKTLFPVITRPWWFASVYIGLYLLSPFLNIGIKRLSRRQHGSLLIVGALMFCLPYDTFNVVGGYSLIWFIYLYCLAAYFRLHKPQENIKTKLLAILFVAGCSAMALSRFVLDAIFGFMSSSSMSSVFYSYSSIFCMVASCSLFLLFLRLTINGRRTSWVINGVAGLTFGIFLIHSHFALRDVLWVSLGSLENAFAPTPLFLGMTALTIVAVFTVCGVIEFGRKKLFYPLERSAVVDHALCRGAEALQKLASVIAPAAFGKSDTPDSPLLNEGEQAIQKP